MHMLKHIYMNRAILLAAKLYSVKIFIFSEKIKKRL